jgi:hypothetical protein
MRFNSADSSEKLIEMLNISDVFTNFITGIEIENGDSGGGSSDETRCIKLRCTKTMTKHRIKFGHTWHFYGVYTIYQTLG